MKVLMVVLTVLLSLSSTQGYIRNIIHKKGYCIWYDQCLKASEGAALNCFYNGPAKELNDTKGINLLNKLCPKFSKNRKTCCSASQLVNLNNKLNTLRQLTGRCPSCWQNFLDLFCEQTCSPDQSMFMDPTKMIGFPPIESILEVDYYVSVDFKDGLFDSCKDVVFPGDNEPVLDLLCGESVKTCAPQKLLEYIGSRGSGLSGFVVQFPEIIPVNMTWMNENTFRCNQSFVNPFSNKTYLSCSCTDCSASCGDRHRKVTRRDPYDSPNYRKAILNITANSTYPQNHTGFYRYPDEKFIPFGHIFHLDLLNQALNLQLALSNMKVPYTKEGKTISLTLDDVCYKPPSIQDKCVIESMFQYFQNNKTLLNRCLTALGRECSPGMSDFVKAEYHDHVLYCTSVPFSKHDIKFGGSSCLGENGSPTLPEFVLHGYNESTFEYNMANYLIISFVFKNHSDARKNEMAEVWEKAFLSYMQEYSQNPQHSNLTITFTSESFADHKKENPTSTEVPDVNSGTSNLGVKGGAFTHILSIISALVLLLSCIFS